MPLNKNSYIIFFIFISFLKLSANDSLYQKDIYFQKLIKTKTEIPVFYNEQVRASINLMLRNYNSKTSIILGKTQHYFNLYSNEFKKSGLPTQLLLMMAVCSESNTLNTSNDGASGLWNLSYIIAKKYGLVTNNYIDERKNPDKSNQIAIQYFKDLQFIYQDWLKTLCSFKIGPINLNMAMHKNTENLLYSQVHNNLSTEQQKAVVDYMAFWYIWNYANEHKINSIPFKLTASDTVHVEKEISFYSLSYHLNISEETIKILNPELRLNIVPVIYNQTGVKLPKDKKTTFYEKYYDLFPRQITIEDSSTLFDTLILDEDPNKIHLIRKPRENQEVPQIVSDEDDSGIAKSKPSKNDNDKVQIYYTVKQGDVLNLIADVFDCSISDVKKWNGIKNDKIFKGQKLKIMIPKKKIEYYKKINKMTLKQKQQLARKK